MKNLQGGAPALKGERIGITNPQVGHTYKLSPDAPNNPGALAVVVAVGSGTVDIRFTQKNLLATWSLIDFQHSFRPV